MVTSAKRELISSSTQWSIPHLLEGLKHALRGDGPAIAIGLPSENLPREVASDISLVVATSGSTRRPKAVALSARAISASTRASHNYLGAKKGQRWSLLLPLTHIAGINVLLRSLELGTTPFDLRNSEEYSDVDYTAIVPTQLFRALNSDTQLLAHLKNAKAVLVGGAPLADEIYHHAIAENIKVIRSYGMSETAGGCVYDGNILDGVEVAIANGLIKIRGEALASNYLNAPDLWNENFNNGWFTTSDLGRIEDGKLIVTSRSDDQIISGGEKISLSAIEELLNDLFERNDIVAFSTPDPEWGEKLCIASVLALDKNQISEHIRSRYAEFAIPKEIFKVDSIPTLGIGKPDRMKLRKELTQ